MDKKGKEIIFIIITLSFLFIVLRPFIFPRTSEVPPALPPTVNDGEVPAFDYDSAPRPVTREAEIDTQGWITYRNEQYGFVIQHPPHYAVAEHAKGIDVYDARRGTREGVFPAIIFEKARSSLRDAIADEFFPQTTSITWGGLKVDPQTTAVIARRFTGEPSIDHVYLFVRGFVKQESFEFPLDAMRNTYDIIRAEVRATSLFNEYIERNIPPPPDSLDEAMTEPEQILATFRFVR